MTTTCRILLTSLERKDGTPAARRHPLRAWTQRTAAPNKWYCYCRAAPDGLPRIAQTSSGSPRRGPRALGAIVLPESATGFRCYASLHPRHGPTEHHFLVCGICARNRRRGAQKMHVPSTRAQRVRDDRAGAAGPEVRAPQLRDHARPGRTPARHARRPQLWRAARLRPGPARHFHSADANRPGCGERTTSGVDDLAGQSAPSVAAGHDIRGVRLMANDTAIAQPAVSRRNPGVDGFAAQRSPDASRAAQGRP
jgi:hypothetical protein